MQLSADLRSAQAAVKREVEDSRGAWPSIAGGLPQAVSPSLSTAMSKASLSAEALPETPFAIDPAKLTGPAAGISGIYENYARLAERGWKLTRASMGTTSTGTPAQASFARANSSLYISAIYDAHYDLSLLGKSLASAYERLGGPSGFGAKLTQSEVDELARAYSIPAVRLEPHPRGSAQRD